MLRSIVSVIGRESLENARWVMKNGGHLISVFQPPEQMKPVGFPQRGNQGFVLRNGAYRSSAE